MLLVWTSTLLSLVLLLPSNSIRLNAQNHLAQQDDIESSGSTSSEDEVTPKWTKATFLTDPPDERRGHTSIVLGNELLMFGGCYLDQKCFNDLHSFDTITNAWTSMKVNGIPPSAREGHTAIVVGSKMYLFGGSGSNSYYNDLYTFDLETKTWLAATFAGPKPSPRSNHGAVVDKKGRILIFGGFTENGYSNEVFLIDPVEERWEKPFISGQAPIARESFSMNRVRNTIWIFGGFTDGGVLNDLCVLDLDSMSWNSVETYGTKPEGRQGHGAILQEKNLILFGGCNYKINTCYSDTYYLDIDSLWWRRLSDKNTQELGNRESFSSNVIGAIIYAFGGCKLYEECYNDMPIYDTGIPCPNQCSSNGVCRNNQCMCFQGYFGNDCSLETKCKDDCNGNGQCATNGKCSCYPGYAGEGCDIFLNCPNNCTDIDHGICQTSGQCKCYPGFSGEDCSEGKAVLLPCPDNCSNHGECDHKTGICMCEAGFTGDKCSETIDETQLNDAKVDVAADQAKQELEEAQKDQQIRNAVDQASQRDNSQIDDIEPSSVGLEGEDDETKQAQGAAESTQDDQKESNTEEQTEAQAEEQIKHETVPQEDDQHEIEPSGVSTEAEESLTESSEKAEPAAEEAHEEAHEEIVKPEAAQPINETVDQLSTKEAEAPAKKDSQEESKQEAEVVTPLATKPTKDKEDKLAASSDKASQSHPTEAQVVVTTMTPAMFAEALPTEKKPQTKSQALPLLSNLAECPNSCSFNGLCRDGVCYCTNDHIGEDCSISHITNSQDGEPADKLLKFAAVSFLVGIVIGIFVLIALLRKIEENAYRNIEGINKAAN